MIGGIKLGENMMDGTGMGGNMMVGMGMGNNFSFDNYPKIKIRR